jgi:hypothetical protein
MFSNKPILSIVIVKTVDGIVYKYQAILPPNSKYQQLALNKYGSRNFKRIINTGPMKSSNTLNNIMNGATLFNQRNSTKKVYPPQKLHQDTPNTRKMKEQKMFEGLDKLSDKQNIIQPLDELYGIGNVEEKEEEPVPNVNNNNNVVKPASAKKPSKNYWDNFVMEGGKSHKRKTRKHKSRH